jgi:hypothetical protein
MDKLIETAELAHRLHQIRLEQFGEHGAPELARALDIPPRTWLNYENGVQVPGTILLRLMVVTGVEPAWLAHGRGPRYRNHFTHAAN